MEREIFRVTTFPYQSVSRMNTGSDNLAGLVYARGVWEAFTPLGPHHGHFDE